MESETIPVIDLFAGPGGASGGFSRKGEPSVTRSDRWTRNQLLLALRLYMRLPFGRLHRTNPEIVELARRIGRTPSAMAMKASNFASLDPTLQARGIRGLSNLSSADRSIWDEFASNPEALAAEAEEAADSLHPTADASESAVGTAPDGPTDVVRSVRTRRVQSFFRAAVLTTYNDRCALSGIRDANLLIASHIIPWSQSVQRRADPRNGILLNSLFDRAFDAGLFTFDDDLRVIVSARLESATAGAELSCGLREIEGLALSVPDRFPPDAEAIGYHRANVFLG